MTKTMEMILTDLDCLIGAASYASQKIREWQEAGEDKGEEVMKSAVNEMEAYIQSIKVGLGIKPTTKVVSKLRYDALAEAFMEILHVNGSSEAIQRFTGLSPKRCDEIVSLYRFLLISRC
jgi:predicted mannosyl-3-phosphoglycerate phosphatase (HAD superfamily)